DAVRVSPQRNAWNRTKSGNYNGLAPANLLRPRAKDHAAQQRANVVNNGNQSHDFRRETMVLLQECGIHVLRTVAEGVESKHQHDEEKKAAAKHQHVTAEMAFFLDA